MNRAELIRELVRHMNEATSREELSSWALAKIVEIDNQQPPLATAEHELLEEILSRCAFQATDGFELSTDDLREMIGRLHNRV
jgi:hypothetical protein